jgi:methionyl-tRNA formyltransferase
MELGVRELRKALDDVAAGRVRREPQAGEPVLAPKIRPELARLEFSSMSAARLHDRVRGLACGPRAFLSLALPGRAPLRLTVLKTSVDDAQAAGRPGEILRVERSKGVLIQCSPGRVWVREVQPEGKKRVFAADFLNGARLKTGDLLGAVAQPGKPGT